MGLLFIKVVILAYVIGYQLVVQQVCLRQSEIESSVRLQVQEPASSYRWRSEKTADTVYGPPYCLGTESLGGPLAESYSLGGDGTYSWKGPGADGTVLRQRACQYLDRATGVPLPDVASTFVTTETRTTPQALPEGCAGATSEACAFGPTENYTNGAVTQRAFVADPEYFTVLVDHGLNAVNVPPHGLSRTVAQMSGAMLDVNGERVDACDDYAGFAAGCPAYVKIGVKGSPDIIPIATLLRAAEAGTLDVHSTLPGSLNSKREGGIVVLLEISYSNYFYGTSPSLATGTFDTSDVHYTYTVSTVADTEFKFETSVAPYGNATAREYLNRHGIRVVVATSGRIGFFDLQTALINLTVAFSLLSISVLIMDFIALSCCPLRAVYRRYQERVTVDMSDLRSATEGKAVSLRNLLNRFERDPYCVDPPPPAIAELMAGWTPPEEGLPEGVLRAAAREGGSDSDGAALEHSAVVAFHGDAAGGGVTGDDASMETSAPLLGAGRGTVAAKSSFSSLFWAAPRKA